MNVRSACDTLILIKKIAVIVWILFYMELKQVTAKQERIGDHQCLYT